MRVALFIPCYMDAFEPEVGVATLQLLERLGCKVGCAERLGLRQRYIHIAQILNGASQ